MSPPSAKAMCALALANMARAALGAWLARKGAHGHDGGGGGGGGGWAAALGSALLFRTPQAELLAFALCGWALLAAQWALLARVRRAFQVG